MEVAQLIRFEMISGVLNIFTVGRFWWRKIVDQWLRWIPPNQVVQGDNVESWYWDIVHEWLRFQIKTNLRYKLQETYNGYETLKNYKNNYVEFKRLFFLALELTITLTMHKVPMWTSRNTLLINNVCILKLSKYF